MPIYSYVAVDNQGKEQKGSIDADNPEDASLKLKEKKLYPTTLSEDKASKARKKRGAKALKKAARKKRGGGWANITIGTLKINTKMLCLFTRQLATLLDAGLPLLRGLRTLEKQTTDLAVRTIVGEVADDVESGQTFSEALRKHPKSFDKLFISMIRAGEAAGAMEQVLNRLAEFIERSQKLKAQVVAAMAYPVAVLAIAMVITLGLMIFIVPKFAQMFDDMLAGEPLPAITQFVMVLSQALQTKIFYIIGGVACLVFIFRAIKKTDKGAYFFDLLAIKTPPINSLLIKIYVARFCSTLGTLMSSGVSVLSALLITRDTTGNYVIAKAVQSIHDAVKEGESITKPLDAAKVFPGMVVSMIEVGEETGALPDMLGRISATYEEEVDRAVETLTSLIEPIMIVFLAIVIGGIVIALFLPMIKLIDMIGV